jgi:glyoxylase-like metal-dependent hydrolase (beta-lactamase superfamily II)
MRKLIVALAVLVGLYYWFVMESHMPADANFPLDIAQVRQLADSIPGEKPSQVRYENVGTFRFFGNMIAAGDGWSSVPMPVYSYQLIYPDHTAIIDAALDRSIAPPDFFMTSFDDAAYQRVEQALGKASWIVVTHEHMDHIGGIAKSPNLSALLPALRLTDTQLAHPDRMKPAELPADVFKDYKPLQYDRYHALAPGVVLIAAPGHTPGSQLVYVKLADGRELLFLGDVSWQSRNVEAERERARFMTMMIKEDRKAVFGELKALHELAEKEPGIKQVPGHDGSVVKALTSAGLLVAGFAQ